MSLTASKLRQNIYQILDQVLETGVPIEISRKGRILKIVAEDSDKLSNLQRRDCIVGDPEELVHMDWSDEWRG